LKSTVVTDTSGFVNSNVAVFTQTCVPAPLPNVQIPNQNYHPTNVLDTIVPNVLFEFFDGSSRCISYVNWDKCEFVGTAPKHLAIVETYPFEIQADLRVLGGYTE